MYGNEPKRPGCSDAATADLGDAHCPDGEQELPGLEDEVHSGVCTENVVARPDSAAKAFVDAGGVSPTDAGSLSTFLWGDKWE
jgi:hypothetical protein